MNQSRFRIVGQQPLSRSQFPFPFWASERSRYIFGVAIRAKYRATTARTAFTLAFAHPAQRGVYNSSSREELASPSFLRKTPSAHCASFVLVQSTNMSNHGQRRGTRGAGFLLVFAGVCRWALNDTRLEIKCTRRYETFPADVQ